MLKPHLVTNQDAFARFCHEAETMAALRHPHIIQIFDFNMSADGVPYFVMEYLEGVDLERRLASGGALPVAAVLRIADGVASALGTAHARGIVHRDLKPANIFLMRGEGQEDDFVKVLDFGISSAASSGDSTAHRLELIGTPQFMAPEQALGRAIDGRTDQFALAAITYNMLTGREPFVGADPSSLLYQVAHEQPPPLSRFLSWDTTEIQSVLDRALAKGPDDRFESIVEFARALGTAAYPVTTATTAATGRVRPLRSVRFDRVPRGPWRTVVLGAGVLGLAAVIAYSGWYRAFPERVAAMQMAAVAHAAPPASGEPASHAVVAAADIPPRTREALRRAPARPAPQHHRRTFPPAAWPTIELPYSGDSTMPLTPESPSN
jgi:serine/threonine-protein kinase